MIHIALYDFFIHNSRTTWWQPNYLWCSISWCY